MPLNDADWRQIFAAIENALPPSIVVQGQVVKNDPANNLIWLKEFGDQPIPLFMFDFQIFYFDSQAVSANVTTGAITNKTVKKETRKLAKDVRITCPKVGDIVLVLKQHGSRRLPKCIGVLQSTRYIIPSGDE